MPVMILILTHNSLTLTKRCIASALAQSPVPADSVIVIDNASTDLTPQWLSSDSPGKYTTVLFSQRRSVAQCWNYILDYAFSPVHPIKYDAVLVLNNDTVIRPDTLHWLLANPAPFVTGVSVGTEKELRFPSPPSSSSPHPDFSCFLIRRQCWQKVGPFNEEFELAYCEDCDYHVRMYLAGLSAVSIDLPFYHYASGTLKSAGKAERRLIERAAERNRARFEDMYGCRPGSEAYNAIFT